MKKKAKKVEADFAVIVSQLGGEIHQPERKFPARVHILSDDELLPLKSRAYVPRAVPVKAVPDSVKKKARPKKAKQPLTWAFRFPIQTVDEALARLKKSAEAS